MNCSGNQLSLINNQEIIPMQLSEVIAISDANIVHSYVGNSYAVMRVNYLNQCSVLKLLI